MRDVKQGDLFLCQAKFLLGSISRLDEALEGIEWALSRDPERYALNNRTDMGVIHTRHVVDLPSYRILFAFDENVVEQLWIEESPPIELGYE
jgi:hypothetical protein